MSDGGGIRFALETDGRRMENTIDRLSRRVEKLEGAHRGLKAEVGKLGNTSDRVTNTMIAGAKKMIQVYAGTGGVLFAINQVNKALEKQAQLNDKANRIDRTLGQAQQQVVAAIGRSATPEQTSDFLNSITQLTASKQVRQFTDAELTTIGRQVLSATSGDFDTRARNTRDVLRNVDIFAGSKLDAPTAARSVLSVSQNLGLGEASSGQARRVIDSASGFVKELESQAFIAGPEGLGEFAKLASNISVADVDDDKVKTFTEKFRKRARSLKVAGSLFAALGQRAGDPGGAETATLASNLVTGLRNILPAEDKFDADGRIVKRARFGQDGKAFTTTEQRLEALISEGAFTSTGQHVSAEQLRREFFEGGKGTPAEEKSRAKLKGIIEEALKGGTTQQVLQELINTEALPTLSLKRSDEIVNELKHRIGPQGVTQSIRAEAQASQDRAQNEKFLREKRAIAGGFQRALFDPESGVIPNTTGGDVIGLNTHAQKLAYAYLIRSGVDPQLAFNLAIEGNVAIAQGGLVDGAMKLAFPGLGGSAGVRAAARVYQPDADEVDHLRRLQESVNQAANAAHAATAQGQNAIRGRTEAR